MVSLLKQKAKVGVAQKERKTYDLADVFKKHRDDDGKTTYINQTRREPSLTRKYGAKTGDKIKPEMVGQQNEKMN